MPTPAKSSAAAQGHRSFTKLEGQCDDVVVALKAGDAMERQLYGALEISAGALHGDSEVLVHCQHRSGSSRTFLSWLGVQPRGTRTLWKVGYVVFFLALVLLGCVLAVKPVVARFIDRAEVEVDLAEFSDPVGLDSVHGRIKARVSIPWGASAVMHPSTWAVGRPQDGLVFGSMGVTESAHLRDDEPFELESTIGVSDHEAYSSLARAMIDTERTSLRLSATLDFDVTIWGMTFMLRGLQVRDKHFYVNGGAGLKNSEVEAFSIVGGEEDGSYAARVRMSLFSSGSFALSHTGKLEYELMYEGEHIALGVPTELSVGPGANDFDMLCNIDTTNSTAASRLVERLLADDTVVGVAVRVLGSSVPLYDDAFRDLEIVTEVQALGSKLVTKAVIELQSSESTRTAVQTLAKEGLFVAPTSACLSNPFDADLTITAVDLRALSPDGATIGRTELNSSTSAALPIVLPASRSCTTMAMPLHLETRAETRAVLEALLETLSHGRTILDLEITFMFSLGSVDVYPRISINDVTTCPSFNKTACALMAPIVAPLCKGA